MIGSMVFLFHQIFQLPKTYYMRGNIFSQPYIISNLIGILIIVISIVRPIFGRMILSLIFIAAAIINAVVVLANPEVYKLYASLAALPVYEDFINGSFGDYTVAYVLAIAAGQLIIGIGLAWKGIFEVVALTGAIIFLLAVAPLGAGSSFPCTVLIAIACVIQLREKKDNPWLKLLIHPRHHLSKEH
jgi:hypothetical protein